MIIATRPRGLVAKAVLLAVLGAAPAAQAASAAERASAREHLTQAQELKKQGNLAEALGHFSESQRLDPKLMTLVDLADCEEQLGKLVEAQVHWAAAVDKAKEDSAPRTKQRAEERLAAVEKRVASLTLQVGADAAGGQVFRDEVLLAPASFGIPIPTNPGDHTFVVKLAGHDDAKYPVTLAEGDNQTVALAAGPKIAAAAPPPPKPKPAAPPPTQAAVSTDSISSGSGQRAVGIILGSVGIVGMGGGAYLWIDGARNANSLGPSSDRNKLLGRIAVGTGGALLVTGIVLLVTAPSGEAQAAHLPIVPTLGVASGSTFVGAAGAF
jgi:hypothetical protein